MSGKLVGAEINGMRVDTCIIRDDNAARRWQVVPLNRNIEVCVAHTPHQSLLVSIPIGNSELAGERVLPLDAGMLLDLYGELSCPHLSVDLNNRTIFDSIRRT